MITLFLIVIAGAGIIYALFRIYRTRAAIRNLPTIIEQAESVAVYTKRWLAESPLDGKLADEKKKLASMEESYIHLKDRYIRTHRKLWALATDWWAYNDILSEIIHSRETLDTDMSPGAHERYERDTRSLYMRKADIESRFGAMMGTGDHEARG